MQVTLEISIYPLNKNYSPVIHSFIDALTRHPSVKIKVQPLSTLMMGDFDECIRILNIELKKIMDTDRTIVTQLKIINVDLSDQ